MEEVINEEKYEAMCHEQKVASEECLALQKVIEERASECRALVVEQLLPAATTRKRNKAVLQVIAALDALAVANKELFEGLADVEDAV